MKLEHLNLDQLGCAAVNVRKKGGKEIADLVPSIRSLGLLQPLLVRPNCEDFEIVAGQRRYHALVKLAEEATPDPVPCIIMEDGDDAKAIEASLAENIARLPMDEIDQYKAFSALAKQGSTAGEIAAQFGVTARLVQQRLAIANLIDPILNAYRREEIRPDTLRILTMAGKRQQKTWWALFKGEAAHAPEDHTLRRWLFGGADIPVENALFDEAVYDGSIISDLFGETRYFDDADKFWALQNAAIAGLKAEYLADGWPEVEVLDIGAYWSKWEHPETGKDDGGRVYIQIGHDGEVTVHPGYLTKKEAARREKAKALNGGKAEPSAGKPELTKAMQTYLDLHRHAAEEAFAAERKAVQALLGVDENGSSPAVTGRPHWQSKDSVLDLFARLTTLDDEAVTRIFTYLVTETLPCGSELVEALGGMLSTKLADHWMPDDTFFDLLRDKEAINAILKEVGGKSVADAHIASTAKVQKGLIRQHLDGTRKPHKPDWTPRYAAFPMGGYTKRGGIDAIDRGKAVKAAFKAA